jgi:hypothetical protein
VTRPSTKLILITASVVVVILLLGIAFSYRNSQDTTLKDSRAVKDSTDLQSKIIELDADQDGLKDWEEVLWQTDPSKADTDGDKTNDGDEIKEGRNPAKSGPKDLITNSVTEISIVKKDASLETTTDKISKDLFTKYIALKLSGTEMTEEDHDLLIANVFQDQKSSGVVREYKRADLHITTTENEDALRTYAHNMGSIIESNHTSEYELAVLKDYLDTAEADDPKPDILERLNPIIKTYDTIIQATLALEVPPSLSTLHLQFLNISAHIQNAIRGLKLTQSDSIAALDSLNNYLSFANQHSELRSTFTKFYDDRGIFFDETSRGYSFTHFYQ